MSWIPWSIPSGSSKGSAEDTVLQLLLRQSFWRNIIIQQDHCLPRAIALLMLLNFIMCYTHRSHITYWTVGTLAFDMNLRLREVEKYINTAGDGGAPQRWCVHPDLIDPALLCWPADGIQLWKAILTNCMTKTELTRFLSEVLLRSQENQYLW